MFVHELKELFIPKPDPGIGDHLLPVQHVQRHVTVHCRVIVGVAGSRHLIEQLVGFFLKFNMF